MGPLSDLKVCSLVGLELSRVLYVSREREGRMKRDLVEHLVSHQIHQIEISFSYELPIQLVTL